MDDRSLVAALVDGAPHGLAGVYDAYADRLFAYAVTLLRDRDAAADAVHDALLVARERAGQLRDPDPLRPWLYAITRSECLRVLRDRRRAAPLDEAGDVIDETVDIGAGARAAELRELVWSAAESLNPGERELLDLSVRHGLAGRRSRYKGDDRKRPLDKRGRAQAESLVGQLLAFGADRLYAAPRTRCRQTLEPLAEELGVPIVDEPALTEESYTDHRGRGRSRVLEIAGEAVHAGGTPVICTQGKVIPDLIAWWCERDGVKPDKSRNRKGSTWVLSLAGERLVAADHIGSPLAVTE